VEEEDSGSELQNDVSKNAPVETGNQSVVHTWTIRLSPKQWVVVKVGCVTGLLGFAGWCLQNFFQLRGVVDLAVSRIFLGLMAASFAVVWFMISVRLWTSARIIIGIALPVAVIVGLDAWAPKLVDSQFLLPAGLPAPSGCPIPNGSFGVYLASSTYIASGHQSVIADIGRDNSIKKELLAVSVGSKGLTVDAAVFDDRQNLVAKVEANRIVPSNYAAYSKRPDKSTLVVYDHLDRDVLNVTLLNKAAVLIRRADFHSSIGGHHILVDGDKMFLDGGPGQLYRNCYVGIRNIVAMLP
jgi:hypothetical protein